MQFRIRIIVAIFALLAVFLTGCSDTPAQTLNPQQGYKEAVSALEGATFAVTVTSFKQTQIGSNTVGEQIVSKYAYTDYMEKTMQVSAQKTITVGQTDIAVSEIYKDSAVYLQINGGCFMANLPSEQAFSRYAIQGILDPDLYETVLSQKSDGRLQIGFTQPHSAEDWALPVGTSLQQAAGNAVLLADGTLSETAYSVTYTYGDATVTYRTAAVFDFGNTQTEDPLDLQFYTQITDIDGPVLLETACAKLLESDRVSAKSVYDIICEAGGLQRTQTTQTDITEQAGLYAQVNTQIDLINYSQQGSISTLTQTETFSDGNYTITSSADHALPTTVTEESMRTYCRNNLASSVLLPQYIIEAVRTEEGSHYRLTFQASTVLGQLLFANAYESLYADAAADDSLFESYSTKEVSGYLLVDQYTGLPVSSSLYYSGSNTAADAVHAFTVSINQEYLYPAQN